MYAQKIFPLSWTYRSLAPPSASLAFSPAPVATPKGRKTARWASPDPVSLLVSSCSSLASFAIVSMAIAPRTKLAQGLARSPVTIVPLAIAYACLLIASWEPDTLQLMMPGSLDAGLKTGEDGKVIIISYLAHRPRLRHDTHFCTLHSLVTAFLMIQDGIPSSSRRWTRYLDSSLDHSRRPPFGSIF